MKANLKMLIVKSLKGSTLFRSFLRLIVVMIALGVVVPQSTILAQGITVTGTVTDGTTGEPLLGVNIVVQGTTTGTVTDLTGNYSITVPNQQSILVFSFVGYTAKSAAVGGQRQISMTLSPDLAALEEVVVVGYGTQKKESVVGAISVATGETIKQGVQGGDLGQALAGSLPGLAVLRTGGLPGGKDMGTSEGNDDDWAYLYIRGQKTWNNAAPLILVDGVERPLNNLNPYEIEKISLLKDASATAVFGVKGANGVILITTLRGKEGKPKLSFDATMTGKTMSRFMQREGSYMANTMKNYAIINELPIRESAWGYIVPNQYLQWYKDQTYPEYLPDVDWLDASTNKWAWDKNVSMNISGGTKVVKYFGSLAYLHEGDLLAIKDQGQGYSPNFESDRINFRSNLDFDITPTTRFSANLYGYYVKQKRPNGAKWYIWNSFYSRPPDLYPVKYSDGTWADYNGYSYFQNGNYLANMFGFQMNKETDLNTDFKLDQRLDFITKGLSAAGRISFDNSFISSGPYTSANGTVTKWIQPQIVDELYPGISASEIARLENKYTYWNMPGGSTASSGWDWVLPPNSYSSESGTNGSTSRNMYYEMSLNYARDFGKHSVSALGLMSRQQQATGSAFLSYREDWVGRVTYGYDRRYNLELNAAYNGSEKFSSKYRFGFFPSWAVGWTVSNEPFFESLKSVVSNLKFRYSDGTIGSDAGINRWLYVDSWIVKANTTSTSSTDVWRFGAPYIQNAYPLRYQGVIPNVDIQWETAKKKDFGIETGFFENMLRMTLDYYWESRTGIFMSGTDLVVPDYFGAPAVAQNKGRVDAHGWEYELNLSKTWQNGLNLWLNHQWTYAVDKVIERGDPPMKPDYQKLAGYPIGQPRYTLNQSDHAIQTWNEIYNMVRGTTNTNALPGDFATVDYNADGIMDSNDQVPYGFPTRPQFTYAPSLGGSYKNFSFNARFYGVYNIEGNIATYNGNFTNQFSVVMENQRSRLFSPEFNQTTTAVWPALRFQTSGSSGYFDRSRSYLRLQHIEAAYVLETQWIKKLGVSNLKFLISGDNLWLYSKIFEDLDVPQITTEGNVRRSYPTMRRVNFGLSFNFQ